MNNPYRAEGEWLYLSIKAVPSSSKSQLGEVKEGRLKVKIAAAPEDGKANEELRSFLAKSLGLAKKDVTLTAGEKSRLKTIRLPGSIEQTLNTLILNRKESTNSP
ncbi:DUF167 domain-containing protein [Leadbettera azotonutricia]|uniref:UPF0235 protein TREAZ_1008 n=1 Tax=Leadbettera azotonutricia (strain ATCC BAA-888 / DSM 13862 / ZAS-9) TaxID=545695 RepID=F5Y874_LEAAZ|nr:DUF167 domain-containing protein [Leadbettera azotonutricia]AEF81226.1 conserved hypothetical protein [Leadbettera azotonutricia ZAS-9]